MKKLLVILATAVSTLAFAGASWALWSTPGTGSASGRASTLAAPTNAQATSTAGTGTVGVTWTASSTSSPNVAPTGYYVQRFGGAPSPAPACGTSSTTLTTAAAVSCSDTGVSAGTYTYKVTAVFGSWTAISATSPSVAVTATVDHFAVSPSTATPTAGVSFAVTVTAQDPANQTAPSYSGVKTLVWSGPGNAPSGTAPTYQTSVTFTAGVGTASVTLTKAETTSLTATQGTITGTSASIVVNGGTATQFSSVATSPQTAGNSFAVTVTAQDVFKNTAASYTGVKTLVWSGPGNALSGTAPTYQTSVTFTAGVGTASVTLAKAETASLTATQGTITGTSASIVVKAASPAKLAWTSVTVAAGTLSTSPPCLFTCTDTGLGNNANFTAKVSVTDSFGNTVSDLGGGHTVTVSTPTTGTGSGGAFTAPTAGTSVTLTIATTGLADSTAAFTFRSQNGSWTSDTFSAGTLAGTVYSNATATVTKN